MAAARVPKRVPRVVPNVSAPQRARPAEAMSVPPREIIPETKSSTLPIQQRQRATPLVSTTRASRTSSVPLVATARTERSITRPVAPATPASRQMVMPDHRVNLTPRSTPSPTTMIGPMPRSLESIAAFNLRPLRIPDKPLSESDVR